MTIFDILFFVLLSWHPMFIVLYVALMYPYTPPGENKYMDQVTEVWLSRYLVLLSADNKTR